MGERNNVDIDTQLRPTQLDELIGLGTIKASLSTFLKAATMREQPLDHVLLRGQPGLGKTTLALAIANALGYELINRTGPIMTLDYIQGLVDQYLNPHPELLKRLMPNQQAKRKAAKYVIFIDELHAIPRESFEVLYTMMEQYEYRGVKLPPFTLIGATTDAGKLPAPLIDRFGIKYTIDYYNDTEIESIIVRSHQQLTGKEISATVAASLAMRSRGTPRRANRLLRRTLDYTQADGATTITDELVTIAMKGMGVDRFGLEDEDRKLLVAMAHFGRPVGLAALAGATGEDVRTIESVMEPYLTRMGFINRTATGRALGAQGQGLVDLIDTGEVPY